LEPCPKSWVKQLELKTTSAQPRRNILFEITAEILVGVQQKIKPKVFDDENLKPLRQDES
jgi:hypothetical protein